MGKTGRCKAQGGRREECYAAPLPLFPSSCPSLPGVFLDPIASHLVKICVKNVPKREKVGGKVEIFFLKYMIIKNKKITQIRLFFFFCFFLFFKKV